MNEPETHHERGESRPDERRYEWTGDTPLSVAVIEAVASASGRDPTEMEPLHRYLDPDALDALFDHCHEDGGPQISFSVDEHFVVVDGRGDIVVYPRSE